MARTTPFSVLLIASFAFTLTILASQAQAQNTTKAECEPLHELYKTWVSPCTNNGTSIPTSDADPAWTLCICKNGFYPLAVANEECANAGTGKTSQITTASLDALCVNATGYIPAASQTSSSDLAPALASATAIASAEATSGASTTANASTSAAGMVTPFSQNFMMAVASFAAMVLATAVAL
ncbi:hypothetical protein BGZ80_002135 [Entomortierella chlamydospora]|uniref:Uncharacterized protein n=1 Tax=Entomortierella chlamydospora TaxID=101097 RepID=A0A9P6SXB4_9FUNG|nr:hypothetical protein BGZ79_003920 [Entomortierella chlamydospora]KAG0009713.1 hypothetical protein BGZ80_002135 [Entomortierella chlamydospora]